MKSMRIRLNPMMVIFKQYAYKLYNPAEKLFCSHCPSISISFLNIQGGSIKPLLRFGGRFVRIGIRFEKDLK